MEARLLLGGLEEGYVAYERWRNAASQQQEVGGGGGCKTPVPLVGIWEEGCSASCHISLLTGEVGGRLRRRREEMGALDLLETWGGRRRR